MDNKEDMPIKNQIHFKPTAKIDVGKTLKPDPNKFQPTPPKDVDKTGLNNLIQESKARPDATPNNTKNNTALNR